MPDQLSGTALAAAVAERVMGWTVVERSENAVRTLRSHGWKPWFCPHESISDVKYVVSEMKRRGYWMSLVSAESSDCAFHHDAIAEPKWVNAETDEVSICRAALAAVEGEKETKS